MRFKQRPVGRSVGRFVGKTNTFCLWRRGGGSVRGPTETEREREVVRFMVLGSESEECWPYKPKSQIWSTDIPAHSITLGTRKNCHCNQTVRVSRSNKISFGTCHKCHYKRGVTETGVTVSGEVCSVLNPYSMLHEYSVRIANYSPGDRVNLAFTVV